MSLFIRLYKITALVLWFCIAGLLTLPYQFKSERKNAKGVSRVTRLWSKGIANIINLHVKISGEIPGSSGGLVVSNHLSYIDIITHGSVLPLRYTPKSEIAGWPILGWYIGLSHPIWIDRKSNQASKKALTNFVETLKYGMNLIVYPEGTSTDGKHGILPFKSASFEAAIESGAPIFPILTRYTETPGKSTVPWYDDMTLLPHIWRILKLDKIEAHVLFLEPIYPSGKDRKELASFVHDVMASEYEKIFE